MAWEEDAARGRRVGTAPRALAVARVAGLLVLLGVGALGCAAETAEPPAIARENTRVLDDATLAALTRVDPDGALHFSPITDQARALAPGHVLVADSSPAAPMGLLREVTAVREEGGELIVETDQAILLQAFQKLDVEVARDFGAEDTSTLPPPDGAIGSRSDPLSFEIPFEGELNSPIEGERGPSIEGALSFGAGFELDIHFFDTSKLFDDLNPFDAVDLELRAEAFLYENFRFDLVIPGAAGASSSMRLLSEWLEPFTIVVAGIPIVFTPKVEAHFQGGFDVGSPGATFGIHQWFDAGVGASCDLDGCDAFATFEKGFESHTPSLTPAFLRRSGSDRLYTRAEVVVSLDLYVYGVAGPYGELVPYIEYDYEVPGEPAWSLDGGLEAYAGIRSSVFGLDWSGRVLNRTWNIAESENHPPFVISGRTSGQVYVDTPIDLSAETLDYEDGLDCCAVTVEVDGVRIAEVPSGGSVSHTFVDEGSHLVVFSARDGAGLTTRTELPLEVVNAPPDVRVLAPTDGEVRTTGRISRVRLRATDANEPGGVLTCSAIEVLGLAAGDSLIGCQRDAYGMVLELLFDSPLGTRPLQVRGTDTQGATDVDALTLTIAAPPVGGQHPYADILSPHPGALLYFSTDQRLAFQVDDPDDTTLHYEWLVAFDCPPASSCTDVVAAAGTITEPGGFTTATTVEDTFRPVDLLGDQLDCGGMSPGRLILRVWGDTDATAPAPIERYFTFNERTC